MGFSNKIGFVLAALMFIYLAIIKGSNEIALLSMIGIIINTNCFFLLIKNTSKDKKWPTSSNKH